VHDALLDAISAGDDAEVAALQMQLRELEAEQNP
jgi:hypothetical protein